MNSTRRTLILFAIVLFVTARVQAESRPHILWITSEDNGPHLGAYGDEFATTPNLDKLAQRGLTYLNAWSNAPVCAPARTTIIAGVYPTATGSEHMRSMTQLPAFMKMYPQFLRAAGYYCTNNSKEDYNLAKPGKVWDESSRKAHWRNRGPDQPFFAIFNFTTSHESQIRKRPHQAVHDPSQVRVPAYHPDTPEVRQDWAQYYDKLTEMDAQAGDVLQQLADEGLADDTIIFYYADHGSGMPRNKRWPYNSGLHVPLIVHVPEKFAHLRPPEYEAGAKTDRLVGFIDLAPTLLSLVGIEPPAYMQGGAFMGKYAAEPSEFLFGFRGRMDERYDMVRSVRDKRYVYIRNYMPQRIYGQYLNYMFQTPTTQVWHRMFHAGQLDEQQSYFWQEKPTEELYDLNSDPDEVNNLATSKGHTEILARLRAAHRDWVFRVRDVGFLPEAEIHARAAYSTPYTVGHDSNGFDLERIFAAAQLASRRKVDDVPELLSLLDDQDNAVRYWAALGLLNRWPAIESPEVLAKLRAALADDSKNVRVLAAEALGRFGSDSDLQPSVDVLLELANIEEHGLYISMFALNSLDQLDNKAAGSVDIIRALPRKSPNNPARLGNYVPRLLDKIVADLE